MMDGDKFRSSVIKSLFWAYLEAAASQLLNFIVTVILARLLLPDDYGTIALISVFINLANVFVTSGLGSGLIQKENSDDLDYNTMFWANTVLSCILYAALFFAAPLIADFYDSSILTLAIRVLALKIPLSAYNSIQMSFVSNRMVFKKSFISTSAGSIISGLLGICFALLGFGIWALVAQNLANILFNTIFLSRSIQWKPRFEFSYARFKSLFQFGWKILFTSFMFTAYAELRSLVIGKKYSAEDLGFYNRGWQFPQFVASNIDNTINRVMFPAFSKNQSDMHRLAGMARRSAKTSAFVMTPLLFGLAFIANDLVEVLLTEKWLPCVPYLQIMCFVWWLQPTQSCAIQGIKAVGRSDLYLIIEIINKSLGVSLLIGAVLLFDTPLAIAVSMFIGQLCAMVVYGIFMHRIIGYKLYEQFFDLLVPALISIAMCAALYFVAPLIDNVIISLIIQIVLGALLYVLIAMVFRVESFVYLRQLLVSKMRG